LQYALADKQFYSSVELRLIKSQTASWRYKWKKSDFSIIKFVKQDIVNAIFKTDSKNWEYFYKHVGRDFNEFSLLYLFETIRTAYSIQLTIVEAFVVGELGIV
jgi:hypothetical protein